MGAVGLAGAGHCKLFRPRSGIAAFAGINFGPRATASNTSICPHEFSAMGTTAAADTVRENSQLRKAGSTALDRYFQQLFSSRDEPRRPRSTGPCRFFIEMPARGLVFRPPFL